ncbi:hypothetical protein FM109_12275 [Vibrio casei]|nr:hypothetical protein FM109_12275 [Vibrio casei]
MNKKNGVKLTLIRGLPGSGKSTFAKVLAKKTDAVHFETDMYFVDDSGEYRFAPNHLEKAHQWCQQQTYHALLQGKSVIVSNTFVRYWEMKAYKEMANKLNVKLEIQVCRGNYGSIHDIEPSTIIKMKSKWQN